MAKKYLVPINLSQQELQNAKIQNLASAPSSPVAGQVYFDTTLHQFGVYNDNTTSWVYLGSGGGTVTAVSVVAANGFDGTVAGSTTTPAITIKATPTGILKSNGTAISAATAGTDYYAPTGTDVAVADGGTGSSTAAGARTNLGLVIGTDVLAPSGNGSALTGITESQVASLTTDLAAKAPLASPTFTGTVTVPTPSNATDASTKGYVDNAVQGLSWKQTVRAATTANGTLASAYANGSVIDGVTLATGNRILIKDQTTGSENGIYVVAASGAPTRALDADTGAELVNATAYVSEGTANAETVWTCTNNATITPGTTALVFAQVNGGTVPTASSSTAGKVQLATQAEAEAKSDTAKAVVSADLANFPIKKIATIGDGSTTAIAVTHSLGTKDVVAQVRDASTDAVVECDITQTSTSVTTFTFGVAPSTNAYKVVIVG